MKIKAIVLALAATIAAPAYAGDMARQLADETGLTPREVRMLLGARTPYAEYKSSYYQAERQFKAALGEKRYRDLMAGYKIELHGKPSPVDSALASAAPSSTAGFAVAVVEPEK